MSHKLIVITGPTASGKTKLASHLAEKIQGEIISADSRQVYKGFDIGSGKDLTDYQLNGKNIPYHLIDIMEAGEKYDVFSFKRDFKKVYEGLKRADTPAILCGGTGMYIEAVLRNYEMEEVPKNQDFRETLTNKTMPMLVDELKKYGELHNTTDTTDRERTIRAIEIANYQDGNQKQSDSLNLNYSVFAIDLPREVLRKRIAERLQSRLDEGLVKEVEGLLKSGISPESLKYYGLEYKFTTMFVLREITEAEFVESLTRAIQKFAKRQMTWFRRMERNGIDIHWLDGLESIENNLDIIMSNEK